MSLQFLSIDSAVVNSLSADISDLPRLAKSSVAFTDDEALAFSVVQYAANDPSTLPENEVCSIDKLISRGTPLYAKQNESFVNHLSSTELADAMIDFNRLTSDHFLELAHKFIVSVSYKLATDDDAQYNSPDRILRELSEQAFETPDAAVDNDDKSTKTEPSDWLNAFHWDSICKLRSFVETALQIDAEVLRLNAG